MKFWIKTILYVLMIFAAGTLIAILLGGCAPSDPGGIKECPIAQAGWWDFDWTLIKEYDNNQTCNPHFSYTEEHVVIPGEPYSMCYDICLCNDDLLVDTHNCDAHRLYQSCIINGTQRLVADCENIRFTSRDHGYGTCNIKAYDSNGSLFVNCDFVVDLNNIQEDKKRAKPFYDSVLKNVSL